PGPCPRPAGVSGAGHRGCDRGAEVRQADADSARQRRRYLRPRRLAGGLEPGQKRGEPGTAVPGAGGGAAGKSPPHGVGDASNETARGRTMKFRSARRRCGWRLSWTIPTLEDLESRTLPAAGSLVSQAVTSNPGVQQMPSVAVDPADSKHLVIAYMDYSLLK